MTAHAWAKLIGDTTEYPILVWIFTGFALYLKWPKRGLVYGLFHEIRPFYLPLVVANYVATVVADGHVVNGPAGFSFAMNLFNWWMYRNAGDDDDRWKRRRRKVTDAVSRVGSRLVPAPVAGTS